MHVDVDGESVGVFTDGAEAGFQPMGPIPNPYLAGGARLHYDGENEGGQP